MTDLNRNRRQIPRHLRIQGILAGVCGFLLILTLVVPDWIEAVFGVDPDNGNGTVEWLIVGCLGVVFVALVAVTTIDWRRISARTPTVETEPSH